MFEQAAAASSQINVAIERLVRATCDARLVSVTPGESVQRVYRRFALEKIEEAEAHLKEAKALLSDEATNVVSIGGRS